MICRCGAATAVFVTCALASALTVFVSMRFKALRAAPVRALAVYGFEDTIKLCFLALIAFL